MDLLYDSHLYVCLFIKNFKDVTKTGNGNGKWEIENGKIKKSKNWKKYEIFILYK